MAGTIQLTVKVKFKEPGDVSMKSGLDGRNNYRRNKATEMGQKGVSMKSGLDGRNNPTAPRMMMLPVSGLNEVRPRWPEQCVEEDQGVRGRPHVSMKSGLDGRNNGSPRKAALTRDFTSTCELSA